MSFLSTTFLISFLILFIVYYVLPKKCRWTVILIFNILFYCSYGVTNFVYIFAAALVSFFTARRLELINCLEKKSEKNKREKKILIVLGVSLLLFIWAFFKFIHLGASPIGISFYSFIAIGYCIDINREKYSAERNFLKYLTFLTFFAHIVQGPFSRYDELSKSLYSEHRFDYSVFGEGLMRIIYGVFKKLVIANRLSVVMNIILNEDNGYGGIYIVLLIFILPLQLYADFSGYMDIAAGCCKLLGIKLQENFRQPIFAKTIDEFWRRWHITLGAFFKDYLFYSISMGKLAGKITKFSKKYLDKKTARMIPSYIGLIFVWTATGLWHGRAWNYLCWGWLNLICILSGMLFKEQYAGLKGIMHIKDESRGWKLFQMLRTFLIFGLLELISDSASMSAALRYIKSIFTVNNYSLILEPVSLFVNLKLRDVVVVILGLLMILIIDILKEKNKNIYLLIHKIPVIPRYVLYSLFFYLTAVLSYLDGVMGGFSYAQF